jgi:hypothetical protein
MPRVWQQRPSILYPAAARPGPDSGSPLMARAAPPLPRLHMALQLTPRPRSPWGSRISRRAYTAREGLRPPVAAVRRSQKAGLSACK